MLILTSFLAHSEANKLMKLTKIGSKLSETSSDESGHLKNEKPKFRLKDHIFKKS